MPRGTVPEETLRRIVRACSWLALVLPLLVLASWALGRWNLGTFGPSFVPMAPSTALLLLLLAGGALLRDRWPGRTPARAAVAAAAGIALLGGALLLAGDSLPGVAEVEASLGGGGRTAEGIPLGKMSLVTAGLVLFASLGLLLSLPPLSLLRGVRTATSTISLGVALAGLVTLSGYATGNPLLYGSGLVPMAATTALEFLLLGVALLLGGDPRAWVLRALTREPATAPRLDLRLTSLALGATAAIGALGFLLLDGAEGMARNEAARTLAAVSDLKVRTVESWLRGLRSAAEYQHRSGFASSRAAAFLDAPGPGPALEDARRWLDLVRATGDCRRVALVDGNLESRLQSPGPVQPLEADETALSGEAFRSGRVVVSELHACGPGRDLDLDILVPLPRREGEGDAGNVAAVLLLHVDPERNLLPLIRSWPTPSATAETLLLGGAAEGFPVLTPRTVGGGAPGRESGAVAGLAAAALAEGSGGVAEGPDDRGAAVVAMVRAVPGRPWLLLTKIDRSEILAAARSTTLAILLLMGALTGASWLGVALLWRRREARHMLGLLAVEEEGRRMAQQVEHLMRSANDVILLTDGEGRILEVNDRAVEAYRRPAEALRGLRLEDLRAPGEEAPGADPPAPDGAPASESVHVRGDGSTFPVEARTRVVDIGGERRGFTVLRDVTERRAHVRALERLNRLYAILSMTNQVLVRSSTEKEAMDWACAVAVRVGRFSSASLYLPGAGTDGPRARFRAGEPAGPEEADAAEAALRDGVRVLRSLPSSSPAAPSGKEIAAFPLPGRTGPAGAFLVVTREGDPLGSDGLRLLEEVATDLSYSLDHFAAEEHRKGAAEVLRESEERFRGLTEAAPDGVVLFDDHGRVTLWNGGAERMTGFPREEALGREFRAFLVPERHREKWEEGQRRFAVTGEGDLIGRTVEIQALRKDGSEFPAEISLSATRIRGRWNAIALLRDVSQRRREQEQIQILSRAAEQSPVSIVITDTEGTIRYVNPEFTRVTGYAAEEALGANPRILRSGHHGPEFYANLWRTIRGGGDWRGEVRNRRKDGSLYWGAATISPVSDAAGRVTHFVAVTEDITERRLLEDQFRQAQKMEAVGRLAGGVAHDFNNLLTVISGFTELTLGKLPPGDRVRPYLEEVAKASQRAAGVTRQLLAFSRRQVLQASPTDLGNVLGGLEKMLRRLIGEDIDFRLRIDHGPGMVLVDPGQLEQAVVNLCVNARDAMPGGGTLTLATSAVTIDPASLRSRAGTRQGEYVALSVSDTGTGMSAEVRDHIFEPFFTTKEKGKGTGLGLAQVHGIVHQSGGFIEVESEPGKGTTFRIFLPRIAEPGAETAAPAAAIPAGGRERILLVEDERAVADVARDTLEAAGYRVLAALTVEDLDGILAKEPGDLDLLLTDVVMPGRNGREVADLVQGRWPGVPVLYMSGYTDDVISRHGVLDPGLEFLPKPFTPDSLRGKVRGILDRAAAGRPAPPGSP